MLIFFQEENTWLEGKDEQVSVYQTWILYIQFLNNDARRWSPTSKSISRVVAKLVDTVSNIEDYVHRACTDPSTKAFHCKQQQQQHNKNTINLLRIV